MIAEQVRSYAMSVAAFRDYYYPHLIRGPSDKIVGPWVTFTIETIIDWMDQTVTSTALGWSLFNGKIWMDQRFSPTEQVESYTISVSAFRCWHLHIPVSCLFHGPLDQTFVLSVSFTIENEPPRGRTCYGWFEGSIGPVSFIQSMLLH